MSEVNDRLDSWKAIAEYLDRDPTTVMRWAKERGLPVHVVPGEGQRRRAVYAYTGEIDAWLKKSAPPGSNADDRKNQSEIPTEARNDNRPADELLPGLPGDAESANDLNSRARFLARLGMTAVINRSLPSRPGRRRSLWAVFVGGALLAAVAAGAWLRLPGPEPRVLGLEQLTNDGLEKHSDVVTDGARVYFRECDSNGCAIAEIPSTGGEPVQITKIERDSLLAGISPDYSSLLLLKGIRLKPGSVWIMQLPGGSPSRLGSIEAFSVAWSPDGASLAYTTDDGLYLCDANGANSHRIVPMSGRLEGVHWSPDGRQLCMRRRSSEEATFWEVGRDGNGLRRLVPDWDMPNEALSCFFAPDGRYLILSRIYSEHETPWALRLSNGLWKPGAQVTCLEPAGIGLCPAAISPDDSHLYCLGGTRSRYEVERVDPQSKRLEPFLPGVSAFALDVTKDGRWVAYVDDHKWLWRSRRDGSERVQLTFPPLETDYPHWSPDGRTIAFMGRDEGQPWKVRLVSAEGGPDGPLTSTDSSEGAPTWSPDGSRLLFGGLVHAPNRTPGPLVLQILELKDRHLSVVPGSEGLWTARWSPDGRYIAASTEDSRSLMLFDYRSGKWRKLLTLDRILDLRWSWHGESLYLTNVPPEGEPALLSLKIPDQQPQRLVGLQGIHDAGWLGLAPDDSPLIMHELVGGEIYALQCQFP